MNQLTVLQYCSGRHHWLRRTLAPSSRGPTHTPRFGQAGSGNPQPPFHSHRIVESHRTLLTNTHKIAVENTATRRVQHENFSLTMKAGQISEVLGQTQTRLGWSHTVMREVRTRCSSHYLGLERRLIGSTTVTTVVLGSSRNTEEVHLAEMPFRQWDSNSTTATT